MKEIIHYLSRILSIVILSFFSIFIFEGSSNQFTWIDSLVHAFMSIIILSATITSWMWPHIGGWLFIILGTISFFFFYNPSIIWTCIVIGGINFITGAIFLLSSNKHIGKN
jgi:hypothetical protein